MLVGIYIRRSQMVNPTARLEQDQESQPIIDHICFLFTASFDTHMRTSEVNGLGVIVV
jgi:hypothetical protein